MGAPCSNCIDPTSMGCKPAQTTDIIYTGPPLPCTNIQTKDNLTVILQKIDAKICMSAGSQNFQTTLEIGNTASDINARFITAGNPSVYMDIQYNAIVAADATKSITFSSNSIDFTLNGTKLRPASATSNTVDLLLPSKPTGTYTIATLDDIVAGVFDADITVSLSGGKNFGRFFDGDIIHSFGKTAQEVITDIAREYKNPSFPYFRASNYYPNSTVEVGTLLTGVQPFVWAVDVGSGTVPTIDIFDVNAGAPLVTGIPNTGSYSQLIQNKTLVFDGDYQQWKGVGHNTAPVGNFDSPIFTVTGRFYRWWGPVASAPVNLSDGAANRAYALANLTTFDFDTPGPNVFTLQTGTTYNMFIVFLPPGVLLQKVINISQADTPIPVDGTNPAFGYVRTPITVNDASGAIQTYNMYLFNPAGVYSSSNNHVMTTF